MIGPPGEFWRFLVQGFACKADGAEQPWKTLLENLAVAAGFRGTRSPVWWVSTETRRCYYQLENLS